jgi:hypothetical protein
VLHPRYKAAYFNKAKWPKEWIMTAEELLHKQWAKNYQPATVSKPATAKTRDMQKNNYFAEIDDFGKNPMVSDDLIMDWLTSPPLTNVTDPITWWIAMDAAGHPLSVMALDFLTVPGMLYFLHILRSLRRHVSGINRCRARLLTRGVNGIKDASYTQR